MSVEDRQRVADLEQHILSTAKALERTRQPVAEGGFNACEVKELQALRLALQNYVMCLGNLREALLISIAIHESSRRTRETLRFERLPPVASVFGVGTGKAAQRRPTFRDAP